jgi:hypothetical protein
MKKWLIAMPKSSHKLFFGKFCCCTCQFMFFVLYQLANSTKHSSYVSGQMNHELLTADQERLTPASRSRGVKQLVLEALQKLLVTEYHWFSRWNTGSCDQPRLLAALSSL